jgi:hypothetical protein
MSRRTGSPVVIIGLSDETPHGPCTGRVVVGFDSTADPAATLDFAFRAALLVIGAPSGRRLLRAFLGSPDDSHCATPPARSRSSVRHKQSTINQREKR